jgi:hypothetical protein
VTVPTPLEEARARMTEALRRFETSAARAVAVAGDPKATRTAVDDARYQATFALAAIGAAFKAMLRAVRPDEEDA